MRKRLLLIPLLSLLVAALSSCIFDPESKPGEPPPPPQKFENLTVKWHVLNNIEVAYNRRNITRYSELLDAEFIFFLSPGDVGGTIPAQWDRGEEILANDRLFDPNYAGPHRCKSIKMDLLLPENKGAIQWVESEPTPGDVRYSAIIFYTFRFDTEPDTQYESVPGAKARFTVRNVGTDTSPQWRLVEFWDLAEDNS